MATMMDYIQEEQETLVEILQGFVPKKEERRSAIEVRTGEVGADHCHDRGTIPL